MDRCAFPDCAGSVVDGYCDVCGLAPAAMSRPPLDLSITALSASAPATTPPTRSVPFATVGSGAASLAAQTG
ncbi:hypothetical protein, partial [Actinomadura sp. HBU206391]|uniref:hypothetical protein n=1 Tax=Actinomadura sp. HBU206391 TaxID=2731692 RepID=UPI001C9C2A9F